MNNLKAIFFDADGTLVNHKECEKQALIYVFDSIGVNYKNDYQDIFRHIEQTIWDNESYNGIPVPRETVFTYRFKLLFEKLNINYNDCVKANDFFKVGLANSVALNNNAIEIIEYLHGKKYLLCVVTNGLIKLQRPRVINSKIGEFITNIIVSEEVDAPKPNALIFNTLLKRIELNANDVVMVGDSIKNDIQGARNAGIKSIWYNPENHKNETGILPDYEINDLLQLKNFVNKTAE
ncbi:MAG: YjjG family noncanonical pyrimidine nucleotidase [Defluviitaleaceae bacterium]|nr:YjjG family noncanonical pyrimidine nucleotidase [Defluviitaleaceae bacterium]